MGRIRGQSECLGIQKSFFFLLVTVLASCTRSVNIDQGSFLTLEIGDHKDTVLAKLVTLEDVSSVWPVLALEELDHFPMLDEPGDRLIRLASVELDLPPERGEQQYLLNYDSWSFSEKSKGSRVVLIFDDEKLAHVSYTRPTLGSP